MIIRFFTRTALSGTAALAAGLLLLSPATARASARPPLREAASGPSASPAPDEAAGPDAAEGERDGLLYGPGTHARPDDDTPDPPDGISAKSWLVADAETGDILAAKNAHRQLPPASTLKTLFAVTTLPHLRGDELHTVTDADLAGIGDGSSMVGIESGDSYSVSDLWRGVFLRSGNDAVHVLASMNGGWQATVRQMQDKARELGASDTHVVSCDGYDEPGQVSSAYDLAVFGRTGLADPDFERYASTIDAQFPGDDGTTFGIENTNRLLSGSDGVTRYPGLIGVKNGYTTNAGNTLVAAAHRDGRTILVTVMNPQSGKKNAVYDEARSLLDWGFEAAGRTEPVGTLGPLHRPEPAPSAREAQGSPLPARDGGVAPRGERPPTAAGAGARGRAARASADDGEGGFLLPMVLTGSACVAAVTLFVVRRTTARRRSRPQ